jgi:hypothetical protein
VHKIVTPRALLFLTFALLTSGMTVSNGMPEWLWIAKLLRVGLGIRFEDTSMEATGKTGKFKKLYAILCIMSNRRTADRAKHSQNAFISSIEPPWTMPSLKMRRISCLCGYHCCQKLDRKLANRRYRLFTFHPMALFSCQILTHVLCLVGLKITLLLSLRTERNKFVQEQNLYLSLTC